MRKYLTGPIALIASFVLAPHNLEAKKSPSYSAAFLQLQPSARQLALGETQVAASGHLEGQFSNPGLLGTIPVPEIFFSHNSSFMDNNQETLGLGIPHKNHAFSATLQYLASPSIRRTEVDGSGNIIGDLGQFKPSVSLARLGWAFRATQQISIGLNTKAWKEELDQKSYGGTAADAGMYIGSIAKGLDAGFSMQNMGGKQNGFNLPQKYDLGLAYQPTPTQLRFLRLLTNYSFMNTSQSLNLGLEADRSKLFSLRAGYKLPLNENIKNISGLSLGAAFRYRGWQFDYAWKTTEDLEDLHMFSLTIGLGLTPEEKKAATEKMDQEIAMRILDKSNHHLGLAENAAHQKDWDQALEELNASLTWNPLNTEAKTLLSNVSYQKNKSDSIKQYYRGLEAAKQKEWIDALLYFQESIKLHGTDNPAHAEINKINNQRPLNQIKNIDKKSQYQDIFDKGVSYYIQGDFTGALSAWEMIPRTNRDFPELKEYMAKAKSNILEAKLTNQLESSKNNNQQIETLSRNAYTYYTLGNFQEAAATWEKILVLDPHHQEAEWAIKQIREKKEMEATPSNMDRKVQELNSQAFLEYSSGRLENSIRLWRKALNLNPRDVRIRNNIERVESEMTIKASMP